MNTPTPRPQLLVSARLLAVLLAILTLVRAPVPAHAASITVTTTADSLVLDGKCSLREAIIAVNTQAAVDTCDGAGSTRIDLPAGTYLLSLDAPSPVEDTPSIFDLDVSHDLTIIGAGEQATIIDANNLDRVLEVITGTVTLRDLTLQNGSSSHSGGAISNHGVLWLKNVILTHNFAAHDGGAVQNYGTMYLESSSVSSNQSLVYGGAFDNHGTLQLVNSVVSENHVEEGSGGAFSNRGTLTLLNSQVLYNQADGSGGGIWNRHGTIQIVNSSITSNSALINDIDSMGGAGGIDSTGTLTITDSTVSDNSGERTGGIENGGKMTLIRSTVSDNAGMTKGGGMTNSGELSLVNSTISKNRTKLDGGGIQNHGRLDLLNVTIAMNRADDDQDGSGGGGGIASITGTANLTNTIIAFNSGSSAETLSCSGRLTSYGHNLIQIFSRSLSSCSIVGETAADLAGDSQAPPLLLGSLQINGGPTLTHALFRNSPLIDAGDPAACPATDQRGVARPGDGDHDGVTVCDIGAFELHIAFRISLPAMTR
jgi:CSLREA domain-containing protein